MRDRVVKVKVSTVLAHRRLDSSIRMQGKGVFPSERSTGPGCEPDRISVQQFQMVPRELRSGEGTRLQMRKVCDDLKNQQNKLQKR